MVSEYGFEPIIKHFSCSCGGKELWYLDEKFGFSRTPKGVTWDLEVKYNAFAIHIFTKTRICKNETILNGMFS